MKDSNGWDDLCYDVPLKDDDKCFIVHVIISMKRVDCLVKEISLPKRTLLKIIQYEEGDPSNY